MILGGRDNGITYVGMCWNNDPSGFGAALETHDFGGTLTMHGGKLEMHGHAGNVWFRVWGGTLNIRGFKGYPGKAWFWMVSWKCMVFCNTADPPH